MKTETPRTDAIAHAGYSNEAFGLAMLELCRELERELADANKVHEEIRACFKDEPPMTIVGRIKQLKDREKALQACCDEWADDHTHAQTVAKRVGCSDDEVEGSSYGVPGIQELIDLIESHLLNSLLKIKQDNAKLREALEHYSNATLTYGTDIGAVSRKALEETK